MSRVLTYQTGPRAKLESDRADGPWYLTRSPPSCGDRSQILCVLRRSGSEPYNSVDRRVAASLLSISFSCCVSVMRSSTVILSQWVQDEEVRRCLTPSAHISVIYAVHGKGICRRITSLAGSSSTWESKSSSYGTLALSTPLASNDVKMVCKRRPPYSIKPVRLCPSVRSDVMMGVVRAYGG